MKNFLHYLACCLLLWSCQKNIERNRPVDHAEKIMPVDSINAFIASEIAKTGQFEWKTASDRMLWSALAHSDYIVSLGYRETVTASRTMLMSSPASTLNASQSDPPETQPIKEQLLDLIFLLERKIDPALTREMIEIWPEPILPVLNVRLTSYENMLQLRYSAFVRYLEPMNYESHLYQPATQRQSGCEANLPDPTLRAGWDYGVVSPFAKASWNYPYHGLLDAWRVASGTGISVFLIDTGIGYQQENLGDQFNQGLSQKRRIERVVTLPRRQLFGIINLGPVETPEDQCGHGTAMAGVLAAPRGTDGNIAGVAYNTNLIACRAAEDVFIDAAREVRGVSDAFVMAANRKEVKVISMSMGRITVSSQLRDAIQYAYNKGKLIFCAAGTSMSFTSGWAGVIFPATMSEVQAVTGVREGGALTACTACHSGPQVDFVVVMERTVDKKHPLTVADRGDIPSTIGGSSVATATMAGMAALVWSRFPWFTAAQLLDRLEQHSTNFPNRHSQYGWGLVQPAQAVY